ncbi:MAG TPA: polyamine ABC transporter substrate-binding protein [Azospirillaceae bacterium]|nr:polyamine ABC transporter substrate-binding protein [Azospirillaceae bacterium]
MRRTLVTSLAACAAVASLALPAMAQKKTVNVFNWSDYIGETTLADFTRETGIEVNYDVYDSNDALQARLSVGRSGFDVVVPTAEPFLARQIQANLLRPLDRSKIPNWKNLDPELMKLVETADPGNKHGVIYQWGTNGIGYDVAKIKERMADAPVDSWRMIFDPEVVKRFADCGVSMLASPSEVLPIVLLYLGKDPNSQSEADLRAAQDHMLKIRPFVKQFRSQLIDDLATGEACLVLSFSGDILQAAARAEQAGGPTIEYSIPSEGTMLWFDMMAIPADAPSPDLAHEFINHVLKPEVMAGITNFVQYANAVPASLPLVDEEVRTNTNVFPTPEMRAKMFTVKPASQAYERARTRAWTRITTGQ